VTRAGTLDYMAPEVFACPNKTSPDENKSMKDISYSTQVRGVEHIYRTPPPLVASPQARTAGTRAIVGFKTPHQVDVWAVGILAYELLVGHPPFEQDSRMETYESIMNADPEFPAWVSPNAREFVLAALCKVGAVVAVVVPASLNLARWAGSWMIPPYIECPDRARRSQDSSARPNVRQLARLPWLQGHAKAKARRGSTGKVPAGYLGDLANMSSCYGAVVASELHFTPEGPQAVIPIKDLLAGKMKQAMAAAGEVKPMTPIEASRPSSISRTLIPSAAGLVRVPPSFNAIMAASSSASGLRPGAIA